MKLLLTSAGVQNQTITTRLVEMLGKPIAECDALCITTASYAHPMAGPKRAWHFITGIDDLPMTSLGWKSIGVLELTALPSLNRDLWGPLFQQTDVLLINGGETMYLAHWLKESGLFALLPDWPGVWVGLSAGSLVMTPRIGAQFVHWPEDGGDDTGLGVVDFAIFPHLDHPALPHNTMAHAESWAAEVALPAYAIDDQTAIAVVDGEVEVLSEGHWRFFEPSSGNA